MIRLIHFLYALLFGILAHVCYECLLTEMHGPDGFFPLVMGLFLLGVYAAFLSAISLIAAITGR